VVLGARRACRCCRRIYLLLVFPGAAGFLFWSRWGLGCVFGLLLLLRLFLEMGAGILAIIIGGKRTGGIRPLSMLLALRGIRRGVVMGEMEDCQEVLFDAMTWTRSDGRMSGQGSEI